MEVTVELRTEPLTGAALLRWRVTPQRGVQRPLLRLVTTDRSGDAVPATGKIAPDGELSQLLSLARADLASELSGEQGPDVLLARVVELTLRWVPGTEHASVTRVVDEHTLRTSAATLNLYSSRAAAFTPIAELLAPVFAARASIAMGHTDDVHNLRQAIASRQTIGQAAGILMERHKLTAEEAFDRLVAASQNSHVKLREIAAGVAETGEEPDDIRPSWAAGTKSTGAHASKADGRADSLTVRRATLRRLRGCMNRYRCLPGPPPISPCDCSQSSRRPCSLTLCSTRCGNAATS